MTANEFDDWLVALRHDFHRTPEVGFEEVRTSERIARELAALGIEVTQGVGGTGVVGTLTRGTGARAIGLRADMDALTLHEVADHGYVSTIDGVMHACGHDGHMTMLLGAASVLARDGGFDGTVRFVFQPAEEHGRGARAMLDDGLLTRFPVEAMYGLHNIPGIPVGHLHTRAGAIMASEDNFMIRIHGRGGHASRPQAVVDPLVVGAEIITALQTIVARSVDPLDSAVVSCTEIHTDGTRNAIPTEVVISGDTRSYSRDTQGVLERRIRELSEHISAAHGATCEVDYTHEFWPTVNDARCADAATRAARLAVDPAHVDGACAPIMASEDFALYAEQVPACFVFVGNGVEVGRGGTPLHSRDYDFNDAALRAGVDFYVNLIRQELPVSDQREVTDPVSRDMRTREIRVADAGEVLTLQRAAFVQEAKIYGSVDQPAFTETLEQLEADLADNLGCVAMLGDRVVGAVRAKSDGALLLIGRIAIAPDLQGHGIGSALLVAVEDRGRQVGCREAQLFTGSLSVANLRLYERCGYAESERIPQDDQVDQVFLRKALTWRA